MESFSGVTSSSVCSKGKFNNLLFQAAEIKFLNHLEDFIWIEPQAGCTFVTILRIFILFTNSSIITWDFSYLTLRQYSEFRKGLTGKTFVN